MKYLRDHRIPHQVIYTNRTFKVKSHLGTVVFLGGDISKRGMGFMRRIGTHIKSKLHEFDYLKKDYKQEGLSRLLFADFKDGIHKKIREIDIEKAYWNAAKELQIISTELYEEGLGNGLSKIELLACLGVLAKDQRSRDFDGYNYSKSTIINDSKDTKHLWDAISFFVDKAMKECAEAIGDDFYFYWTDAIFFKDTPKNAKKIHDVLAKHNLKGKELEIEYILNNKKEQKVFAYTKENKSHAKIPIKDENGTTGRCFPYIATINPDEVIEKSKRDTVQFVIDQLNKFAPKKNKK